MVWAMEAAVGGLMRSMDVTWVRAKQKFPQPGSRLSAVHCACPCVDRLYSVTTAPSLMPVRRSSNPASVSAFSCRACSGLLLSASAGKRTILDHRQCGWMR